jgi:hypothetical protein
MPEDENRDGLRIGGWVPPYRDAPAPPVEPERRGKARRMPAFMRRRQPALADAPPWTPPFDDEPGMDPTRRSRLVLAAAAGVVVAVIVGFALAGIRQAPAPTTPDSLQQLPPPPPVAIPSAAVSILPKPSSSPTRKPTSKPTPSKTKPKTTAPTKTAPPSGVLVAGSAIGLEVAGYGGYRVEHNGSDVDVDRIGANSDADDRAASRFIVRKGLGSSSCLSFEAADAPGHFLRHRDYELRLDARDGSSLFNQDATFCPQPSRGGSGVVLRSVNYPDRALSVRRGEIRLDDDSATTFEAKPPL